MAPSIHRVLAGSARVAVTVSMNFGRAGSRSYVPVHPLPRVKGMHYRRTLRSITDSGVLGGDRRRLAADGITNGRPLVCVQIRRGRITPNRRCGLTPVDRGSNQS
jgi:hypothetical protein